MNADGSIRLALGLPIAGRAEAFAALQVVLLLLRDVRVELDIMRENVTAPSSERPVGLGSILFVGANFVLAGDMLSERQRLEASLRRRIERLHARQGVAPVRYDLQLLQVALVSLTNIRCGTALSPQ